MSRPQLVLKQSTGWFAAGWQFGQALGELSDVAFKLYAWLCLNVDRHTGQLQSTVPELSSALKKPEVWTESALRELVERGVCRWLKADVLEIADQYWPYQRQAREAESKDYVGEVRRMLLAPACVRSSFTLADERLAQDLNQRGVSLEQLQRAIWLGCARKYVAMLNGQPPMPITSLRYFTGLIEEVRQTDTPDSYWQHVRSKADQLERQWLQRPAATPFLSADSYRSGGPHPPERCPTSPEPWTASPETNDPSPSETKRNDGNEMMLTPPSRHILLD